MKSRRERTTLILAAAAGTVAWRAAALVLAARQPDATETLLLRALLSVVGLVFVACGLWVMGERPGASSELFALFAICTGLHWGGPLDMQPGTARTLMLSVYLLVSSLLASALFLHLALSLFRENRTPLRPALIRVIYLPVTLGALTAVVYVASPPGGARNASESLFLALHLVVSNVYPVLALVRFVVQLVRPRTGRGERRYVALMVGGMLIAWLPYVVASALALETDPWNLFMVALPLTFAVGLPRIPTASTEHPLRG